MQGFLLISFIYFAMNASKLQKQNGRSAIFGYKTGKQKLKTGEVYIVIVLT